ncbi:hypothetical protein TELCIR_06730 [Teladorsagia circumcincta]|uniref:VWFA domain-containing protein n=1 Tax=Teladorsagia circumcincta TaxID=45464 RepID=A0A2G9UMC5_TELCI|nr:hypothetical protein TELCIR_06730 [Teladorsagia circumcincta]
MGNSLLVATVNPTRLYLINDLDLAEEVYEIDISSLLSRKKKLKYEPRLKLAKYGEGMFLVHEEVSGSLCLVNLKRNTIQRIELEQSALLNLASSFVTHMELGSDISKIFPIDNDKILAKMKSGSYDLLCHESGQWKARPVRAEFASALDIDGLRVLNDAVFLSAEGYHFLKSSAFPLLLSATDVIGSVRPTPANVVDARRPFYLADDVTKKFLDSNRNFLVLRDGVAVKAQPKWKVPKDVVGDGEEDDDLRIEYERDSDAFDISKLNEPKVGKFDPKNAPHHGGDTWMGGTGGYNTAGLGGVGGPFRFDAGHDVYQMPDSAKKQVPEYILKKARQVAKTEYQKKLKEIAMSEYDAEAYMSLWNKIEKHSNHLRSIIEQLEAKKKERQWARHQTSGDLDDGKLIEGVTGERNIYRRRLDKKPEPGAPQLKPKRMRLCFDVSGSMYRFNGHDKRLQKSLEAALMVMTSFDGKQEKVAYDITGHSGDGPCIGFITKGKYPKNNKERLDILHQMLIHTQYCTSGDYTLEGLDEAIKTLSKEKDCDERIVVLISDANLDRYGISPKDIAKIMNKDETVNSFVILIGSLGLQAQK